MPLFFAFIGLSVDLGALADLETIGGLLVGVTALAVVTKFTGAWLAARPRGPRDAVLVGMSVLTNVLVPPILRALAQRGSDSPSQAG